MRAHTSLYDDYVAAIKQLCSWKNQEKIYIFEMPNLVKYRNINIEKILVFVDILQQLKANTT